uniref:Nuclear factor (Erythroid-derived 2)-like 2a n=1 Tax=Iconisemion striatum TaxID=60296 RepID=A0A1A7XNR7_9TELE
MMMEMEVMHSSQQDMDLIDILWKQDIDLGARREVFDYNHRQKEHELQRQRELEEEKKLHLLREQEKALLAQLQLDEETGEYIPRPSPPPSTPLQSTGTALEVTQNVSFTEESVDGMSFDECLQLLAETFPVEETENTPAVSVPTSNSMMMSPEHPALPPASLPSGQLAPPQRMSPDLEQAWMELLSLPELQQCLNMQTEDTMETAAYTLPNNCDVQNPDFPNYLQIQTPVFNPITNISDVKTNTVNFGPAEFLHTFDGPVPGVEMKAEAPQINATFNPEAFSDVFYPTNELEGRSGQFGQEVGETVSDAPNKPALTTMDLYSLSPGDAFDKSKENLKEHPDSDSGISTSGSPNASSPSKSAYGGGSFGYSDSEMEDMDNNLGSPESDYSEMFPLNYQLDDPGSAIPVSVPTGLPQQQVKKPKDNKVDLAEETGHSSAPFTKDKPKKRSDVRLSRDEQRAKSLKIPFTVGMIINLPVDDFNELMSKHHLNEAQLALVRDIRRRGKNKVAAQNCRKRKMENIVGLESELDSLKEEKERQQREKIKNKTHLKEMKQQLHSLYLEVFSMLRDEKGNSYSPLEYSLQQSTDGSVFLVPRIKKTVKSEDNHLSPL